VAIQQLSLSGVADNKSCIISTLNSKTELKKKLKGCYVLFHRTIIYQIQTLNEKKRTVKVSTQTLSHEGA